MEQSETAAGKVVAAAAPVVRQLDFTVNSKGAGSNGNVSGGGKGNLILPEHPQAKLESKLLALAQSQQVHARATPQSPPRVAAQTKLPPRKMVMPPKSPQQELPQAVGQAKSPPLGPRLVHSVKPVPFPKPSVQPLLSTASPKSRERCNLEKNDGTPKKQKQCNCKNSRCLKLYCECFAAGVYCDGCNCMNCHNKIEHEADRKGAIDAILERNPTAFRPKIAKSPHRAADGGVEHKKGCNCKKSGCLKKYCECFQANILCSEKCKCMECKNFEGSEERKAHFHQYPPNPIAFIQRAANAAINEAIGTPTNNTRNQQIVFGMTSDNKQVVNRPPQFHHVQETCVTTPDVSHSPFPVHVPKPKLGLNKSSYRGITTVTYPEVWHNYKNIPRVNRDRSPLTGILQLQDVKDFCTVLVEVSAEAARRVSEERKMNSNSNGTNEAETSVRSSHEESKEHQNAENTSSDTEDRRPLSPVTLALMCDERDVTFMATNAPNAVTESDAKANTKSTTTDGIDQLYVEQERLVLTRFRGFLNRLITRASIEEMKAEKEAI